MYIESTEPRTWRITLSGDLDYGSAPKLESEIETVLEQHPALLIIDLSNVSFLDSSGIRSLVFYARALERDGGRLLVEGASGAVAKVLELTDLLKRLSGEG